MAQPSVITNTDDTKKEDCSWYTSKENKTKYTYIAIAILVAVILYYAYNKFYKNSEEFTEVTGSERTDPINDFNLREAINELENMQKNIISKLSDADNF
jgi:hypothetical protein